MKAPIFYMNYWKIPETIWGVSLIKQGSGIFARYYLSFYGGCLIRLSRKQGKKLLASFDVENGEDWRMGRIGEWREVDE